MSRDTTTGLKFEKETKIIRDGIDVSKGNFKRYIEANGGTIGSWERRPDAAFIWPEDKELLVYEKKFQQTQGSADEKIGEVGFLTWQYQKAAKSIGIPPENVHIIYILSDYFKAPKYDALFEYMDENGFMYAFWSDEEMREKALNYRI